MIIFMQSFGSLWLTVYPTETFFLSLLHNDNTYIVPKSILLFSSALKNKNISIIIIIIKGKIKLPRLHKVYMHLVHEPTNKS